MTARRSATRSPWSAARPPRSTSASPDLDPGPAAAAASAPTGRLRLYTLAQNSAGERVRIALALKRIDHEYVAVSSLPRDTYRRLNPQGLLPALAVGDAVIPQATAILEYLEETCPDPPLLPSDSMLRAVVRGFSQLIASDLHPLNNRRVRRYLGERLSAAAPAIDAWYAHWMTVGLTALEAMLASRPATRFCFGETPGWADLHLVPQLANARRFACPLDPYPRLCAVDAACRPLDAFRRARPGAQPDAPASA